MKKKGIVIILICFVCAVIVVTVATATVTKGNRGHKKNKTLIYVKEMFSYDIQELIEGKYENLAPIPFESSIEDVEAVYNLEILRDNSCDEKTFLENLEIMEESIDKFFGENFDKSFIEAKVYVSEKDTVSMMYDDIEEEFASGKLGHALGSGSLFGNNTSEGGNMVQVYDGLYHAWYSKNGFGTIHPSSIGEFKAVYNYISGVQQEDSIVQLKDGEIAISELEEIALGYMNSDKFPLITADGIDYGVGEARVVALEDYDGVCFKVRRIYKGVPFEYGETMAMNEYIDRLQHDGGEISYVESSSPDTMMGFFVASGTVVEKEEITEMLTAGDALALLSEQIGENSTYEVHGVELVYRNCEVPIARAEEVSDILEPKWKIITINQNDDKYTLFYVDVVTGEITERFEYYYD